MPKETEAYRGEDKTLELIRERAKHLTQGKWVENETEFKKLYQRTWDDACVEIHNEFVQEELYNSANEVLKHISPERLQSDMLQKQLKLAKNSTYGKFANGGVVKNYKGGLIGETGPEAILPPRKSNH